MTDAWRFPVGRSALENVQAREERTQATKKFGRRQTMLGIAPFAYSIQARAEHQRDKERVGIQCTAHRPLSGRLQSPRSERGVRRGKS